MGLFLLYVWVAMLFRPTLRDTWAPPIPTHHECSTAKNQSITLPGFFEVFPELRWRWPTWYRGRRKPCRTDRDCPVPLTCCVYPNIWGVPGEKFCCSGWGRPNYAYAYAYAYAFLPP